MDKGQHDGSVGSFVSSQHEVPWPSIQGSPCLWTEGGIHLFWVLCYVLLTITTSARSQVKHHLQVKAVQMFETNILVDFDVTRQHDVLFPSVQTIIFNCYLSHNCKVHIRFHKNLSSLQIYLILY